MFFKGSLCLEKIKEIISHETIKIFCENIFYCTEKILVLALFDDTSPVEQKLMAIKALKKRIN